MVAVSSAGQTKKYPATSVRCRDTQQHGFKSTGTQHNDSQNNDISDTQQSDNHHDYKYVVKLKKQSKQLEALLPGHGTLKFDLFVSLTQAKF